MFIVLYGVKRYYESTNQAYELMKMPWKIKIIQIPEFEGGGYCACIPELGENRCRGDGRTIFEAVFYLQYCLLELLEDYTERGLELPKPQGVYPE